MLPDILFLVVVSSAFQHRSMAPPLFVVSLVLHYLLGDLLVVARLPRLATYLPLEVLVPVTTFLTVHFIPIVGLF